MEVGEIEMIGKYKRKPIIYKITESGCHICMNHYKDKAGYLKININGEQTLMHRYIYERFIGKIQGLVVRHKCDNPSCINPLHLETGTYKENTDDMFQRNRQNISKGEKHWNSKLTHEKVKEIRKDIRTQQAIANQYGISQSQVNDIKHNKYWRV